MYVIIGLGKDHGPKTKNIGATTNGYGTKYPGNDWEKGKNTKRPRLRPIVSKPRGKNHGPKTNYQRTKANDKKTQ